MELSDNFSIDEEPLEPLEGEEVSHQNNDETHLSDTKHIDLASNVQKNKVEYNVNQQINSSLPLSSSTVSDYTRPSNGSPINHFKLAGDASLSTGAPYLSSDTIKPSNEHFSSCIYQENSLITSCDKAEILNMNFKPSITKSRIKGACDFCRKRKLRCDRGKPCSHCDKRSIECIYSITPSKKSQTSKRFLQKSNKFEEQFISNRVNPFDRSMNRSYNPDLLYSLVNSNDVFNSPKRSNLKYSTYPPYNVANHQMPLQNMYNDRMYNDSMAPHYQRRETFYYDDLEDIFICVNIFIQIYQNTKVHGFSIAYNKEIIADYWRYLREETSDFESLEKENLLTLFEYVLIFLLGAVLAKSTAIVNKLTPIFESIFNILIEKLKIKDDAKTSERFISCLILICSIYEYQGLIKMAYSVMNIAHYMIVTHKSYIRCRSIIECTYISLLTLANNKEERDKWVKILESYSPFSHEVIMYLDLAYIISELKLNYDVDEFLEKRLQNIDTLLNERIYVHTVSYIKVISLILNLEIIVRQKNFTSYSNLINQIAHIIRDLPTPLLYLIQSDCSNLKVCSRNLKDGHPLPNHKSCVMDDVICVIDTSLSMRSSSMNLKDVQTETIQRDQNINFNTYTVLETNNGTIHKNTTQLPIHNRNNSIQFQSEFQYINRDWDNGIQRDWNY